MNQNEFNSLLSCVEDEHLEFKSAREQFSILGKEGRNKCSIYGYCVAIGNEGGGKLVLGVDDKIDRVTGKRLVVGISWSIDQDSIKTKIYEKLKIKVGINEFDTDTGKAVVVTIPSHQIGQVLKFYGIPLMRVGESLTEMDDQTLNKIINEKKEDWSAGICQQAKSSDLDQNAIMIARKNFKIKNSRIVGEVDAWNDETFLEKAKITIKGRVTNAAIILLGKAESMSLISPAVAQITWILKSIDNIEKDYEHFSCPLLLSAEKVFYKIRNLK